MNHFSKIILTIFCFSLLSSGMLSAEQPIEEPAYEVSSKSGFKSVSREKVLSYSSKIDALIDQQLEAHESRRNRVATDEAFLRRAYLDIIGRIPTIEESYAFLESSSKNKHERLIDDLLQSYGYVSRQFNFYADLLRLKTRIRNVNGGPYIDFVKDALQQNMPYDQFVKELLTSEGPMMEKGNGATGYYLRDVGMPEDNMSNTVRVFLGTRLECAQCHDHPFDKWTQRQYFEMVAFTGGMKYKTEGSVSRQELVRAARQSKTEVTPEARQALRRLLQPLSTGVDGSGTGLAKLPEGYMGSDGEEGEIVKAKTIFDDQPLVEPEFPSVSKKNSGKNRKKKNKKRDGQYIRGAKPIDSRMAFGEWVTDDDNPRFAKVIANRLWKQAMGLGLIEPVDVIEDHTKASNPELMDCLTQLMIDLDFDTKQFLRVIYNTKTYQARTTQKDIIEASKYDFPGPVLRRMSAEQIWDSMLTLAYSDIDERRQVTAGGRYGRVFGGDMYVAFEKLKTMEPKELLELANTLTSKDPKAKREMVMEMVGSKDAQQRNRNQQKASKKEVAKINNRIRQARRAKDAEKVRELMIERTELMAENAKDRGRMFRASEMPSPAPPNSFLREFGQSDREEIENADTDPAVTQVLSMMNGMLESRIVRNPNTMLMRNVVAATDSREKIDAIFMTILNRKPTGVEVRQWGSDFDKDSKTAVRDLIWTLVNSNEFIFVR